MYKTDGLVCMAQEVILQPGEAQRVLATCDNMNNAHGVSISGMVMRLKRDMQVSTAVSLNILTKGKLVIDISNLTNAPIKIRDGSPMGIFTAMMANDRRYEMEKWQRLRQDAQ
jgi:hypothetical protein